MEAGIATADNQTATMVPAELSKVVDTHRNHKDTTANSSQLAQKRANKEGCLANCWVRAVAADLSSRGMVVVATEAILPCNRAMVGILNKATTLSSQCMEAATAEVATASHRGGKVEDLVLEAHWHLVRVGAY